MGTGTLGTTGQIYACFHWLRLSEVETGELNGMAKGSQKYGDPSFGNQLGILSNPALVGCNFV